MSEMQTHAPDRFFGEYMEKELQGFSRNIASIQWLAVILVLLFYFFPTRPVENHDSFLLNMVCYALFIITFRYSNIFPNKGSKLQLTFETLTMIVFITSVIWQTGKIESPLINLYLLAIILAAITLGKLVTILMTAFVASCYMLLFYHADSFVLASPSTITELMVFFSPAFFVVYITCLLISDAHNAREKIADLWGTDALTGLYNIRAFNLLLEKVVAASVRNSKPFSVIMLDVDNFKHVNDQHGHSTGSNLLRNIARSISTCIRITDSLARYGGDEFVILCPNSNKKDAENIAERIRQVVSETYTESIKGRVHVTISIGIANYPDCAELPQDVLERADFALYRSKEKGRNKVTYYQKPLVVAVA
jgi:diguanylate cyclase (GGDEF)-like protein